MARVTISKFQGVWILRREKPKPKASPKPIQRLKVRRAKPLDTPPNTAMMNQRAYEPPFRFGGKCLLCEDNGTGIQIDSSTDPFDSITSGPYCLRDGGEYKAFQIAVMKIARRQ